MGQAMVPYLQVRNERTDTAVARAELIILSVKYQKVVLSVALVNGSAQFSALAALVGVITPHAASSRQQWYSIERCLTFRLVARLVLE